MDAGERSLCAGDPVPGDIGRSPNAMFHNVMSESLVARTGSGSDGVYASDSR
jgi:hypothetical protein